MTTERDETIGESIEKLVKVKKERKSQDTFTASHARNAINCLKTQKLLDGTEVNVFFSQQYLSSLALGMEDFLVRLAQAASESADERAKSTGTKVKTITAKDMIIAAEMTPPFYPEYLFQGQEMILLAKKEKKEKGEEDQVDLTEGEPKEKKRTSKAVDSGEIAKKSPAKKSKTSKEGVTKSKTVDPSKGDATA